MAAVKSAQNWCNIANLNRCAVNRLKNGSPKFKDVFRARCRARVKENRDSFLSKLRNTKYADVEEVLSAFGIFELDNNLPLRDLDIEEEITEEEEKIIAEYEALLADEENMYTDLLQKSIEEVVCPVCEKTALVMEQIAPCTSQIVCHRCNIFHFRKIKSKGFRNLHSVMC